MYRCSLGDLYGTDRLFTSDMYEYVQDISLVCVISLLVDFNGGMSYLRLDISEDLGDSV